MKVTVIGQWGGFPKACEASSGYLIQEDGFNLVVDLGSAVLSNLQRYIKIEDIDAVILSHYHHDHIADIGPLQYARLINSHLGKSLSVLPVYGHCYDEGEFAKLTMEPYTKGIKYAENDDINIGPFAIQFCRTKHPVPCFAMRISSKDKTIVYTGDTAYTKELVEFSKDVDLLICECNLYANQDGSAMGHMNSRDAGNLAKTAGANKLLLTHLPHYGDLSMLVREARNLFEGSVELANLGWVFEN